jgi:hypothetical protein
MEIDRKIVRKKMQMVLGARAESGATPHRIQIDMIKGRG